MENLSHLDEYFNTTQGIYSIQKTHITKYQIDVCGTFAERGITETQEIYSANQIDNQRKCKPGSYEYADFNLSDKQSMSDL